MLIVLLAAIYLFTIYLLLTFVPRLLKITTQVTSRAVGQASSLR